jgi:two-component system sensor histidine kinase/response regulator
MGATIGQWETAADGASGIETSAVSATATSGPTSPTSTRPAPSLRWPTPPLVLVAEDSAVNQLVAVRTLERCGCEVDVVSNGRQALDALGRRRYDAVLMDCQMQEMDGYAATAELRLCEHDERHTPVIAMTAHAMAGDREYCLAAGMDDYVSKPISRHAVIEALQRWIPARDGLAREAHPAEPVPVFPASSVAVAVCSRPA